MKNRAYPKHTTALIFAVVCIVISACGLNDDRASQRNDSCSELPETEKINLFKATIWDKTAKCASCHAVDRAPHFRSDNASKAFQEGSPVFAGKSSIMSIKAEDGHCPVCTNNPEIKAAIEEFHNKNKKECKDGENKDVDPKKSNLGNEANRYLSNIVAMTGLNSTTFVDKDFAFTADTKVPATLRNVVLRAGFKLFNNGKYVIFTNLRVITPGTGLRVSVVYFTINGEFKGQTYPNYEGVDKVVSQSTTPIQISSDSQLFGSEANPNFSLQINALMEPGDPFAPRPGESELDFFVRGVRPVLMARCVGCHANVGTFQFTNSTSDMALRNLVRTKVNPPPADPTTSLLLQKAQIRPGQTMGGNPDNKPLENAPNDVRAIKNWIAMIVN